MGRRRRKKSQGFSSKETKPLYDAFTNRINVHGPEKREMLNTFSMWIAGSAALSTSFGGCFFAVETVGVGIVAGWLIGLFVGVIVFNAVASWLTEEWYFRP